MKRLMTKFRKHNKGFSLVELVVVIAIMSVLVGISAFGIGMLSGRPAQKASARFRTNLDRIRTVSMGKTSASLELYVTADGVFSKETVNGVSKDPVMLGPKSVTCSYSYTGVTPVEMAVGDKIVIVFDRSDGSLKSVTASGSAGSSIYTSGTTTGVNEVDFIFTKANKKYKVSIVPITGRVSN